MFTKKAWYLVGGRLEQAFEVVLGLHGPGLFADGWIIHVCELENFALPAGDDEAAKLHAMGLGEHGEALALVALGDHAITPLAHRLRWKPSLILEFLHDRVPRFSPLASYLRSRWDSQAAAAHALGLMGPLAEKAVPDLEALEASKRLPLSCRRSVRFALVRIKQASLQPYVEKLKGAAGRGGVWYENAWILGQCGTNAAAAVPSLLAGLEPTNGPFIQGCACDAVGMIHSRPDVCIPALVRLLKSRDVNLRVWAFRALGRFGREAKPAWSELSECLQDQEAWVRRNATNLLRQIDAEAAGKLGVK